MNETRLFLLAGLLILLPILGALYAASLVAGLQDPVAWLLAAFVGQRLLRSRRPLVRAAAPFVFMPLIFVYFPSKRVRHAIAEAEAHPSAG
ncbi:MAG: hypothetical protein KC492_14545 [Myxococcales bacterium]|nr:hypothetical protein [Myxococcales bacterium]